MVELFRAVTILFYRYCRPITLSGQYREVTGRSVGAIDRTYHYIFIFSNAVYTFGISCLI